MKHISIIAGVLLAGAGLMASCNKDKMDHQYDNRIVQDARAGSGVRIVNLGPYSQVIANNDTLTNFVLLPYNSGKYEYPTTKFFPDKGRLGTTWTVPREFFQNNGTAHLRIESKELVDNDQPVEVNAKDDYNPADYYIIRGPFLLTGDIPQVNKIPRSVEAPSRPDHFKIRIVNLASGIKRPESVQELINGPLSLAFADGTIVNAATSNIAPGSWSEYVEVPYGTYQFKVLTAAGTQVTAIGGPREENAAMVDRATSTITTGTLRPVSTRLTFAPIRTYQPGGIYTIVISPQQLLYDVPGGTDESSFTQNAFQIIADIADPANVTYGRVQVVNALSGAAAIGLKVNGGQVSSNIAYGNASEYTNVVSAMTTLEATDASGKILATVNKMMRPGGNYTAWVYADAKGSPQIAVVANNLSAGVYLPGGDGQDGSFSRLQYKFPFHFRFYNFCPDIPNVNFTSPNGQEFGRYGVTRGLQPGVIPEDGTNTVAFMADNPYQIMAFQSNPGVFPGTWLTQVPVVKSTELIARKELYVRGGIPDQEPGFYTIALIGRNATAAPEASKAKMIIVKHNR
ncbi:DUF4397 domain-containing protein [Chitinophaga varians]|uniref:DUF4397 domain-containing protein n=1 Tax=Chitinophaga varians TaxID=2202339 RepID=UPI00165F58A6|nr:DUF4397 domain-containing protein [Chitinophaga varians]MBC9913490.1 DUF4397 domain-containing protein [Chitinophaga varians]